MQYLDDEANRLFAGIARRIWFRRNEVIHGGLFSHPNVLVHRAREAAADFAAANKISLDTNVNFEKPSGKSGGYSRMVALTTVLDCNQEYVMVEWVFPPPLLTINKR